MKLTSIEEIELLAMMIHEASAAVCAGNTDVILGRNADNQSVIEFPTSPSVTIPLMALYKNQDRIKEILTTELTRRRGELKMWEKEFTL